MRTMTSFLRLSGPLLAVAVGLILVLMPFHAFLSVWASQLLGHYTALRLWKEFLLLPMIGGVIYLLVRRPDMRKRFFRSRLVWLIGAYLAVQMLWGIGAYIMHDVNLTALGYGLVSNMRYLVFFIVVLVIAAAVPTLRDHWQELLFCPLVVVVLFGLLQYFVLPYDALKHFGYSRATIFPYEDINSNLHYLRIMSTLRGANPLGAYLVALLSLLCAWRRVRQWWWYALLAGSAIALVLTFSRGAWVGLAISMAVLGWAYIRGRHIRTTVLIGSVFVVVLASVATVSMLRNTTTLQNVLFHTQMHSAVKTTSDQGHASALQSGLHDITHQPFGRGPGSAGPASVYNIGHPARIAENYFMQVAQETGWLGIGLFVAVNGVVGALLWRQRRDTLSLGLYAGLVGLSVVNLFSHAWTDDTLAYIWWGMAAIALAPAILQPKAV